LRAGRVSRSGARALALFAREEVRLADPDVLTFTAEDLYAARDS
jgi:hypothetical protein